MGASAVVWPGRTRIWWHARDKKFDERAYSCRQVVVGSIDGVDGLGIARIKAFQQWGEPPRVNIVLNMETTDPSQSYAIDA